MKGEREACDAESTDVEGSGDVATMCMKPRQSSVTTVQALEKVCYFLLYPWSGRVTQDSRCSRHPANRCSPSSELTAVPRIPLNWISPRKQTRPCRKQAYSTSWGGLRDHRSYVERLHHGLFAEK